MQMIGLGTIVNSAAIVGGGLVGLLCGKALSGRFQKTILAGMAACVIFTGIAGTLQEMLRVLPNGKFEVHGAMMMVVSLAVGALLGEALSLDDHFERFGEWLRRVTRNQKDFAFVNAFITASLTVCVGAMAIVGSIEDGCSGTHDILFLKAALDCVIVMVMAAAMGKGAIFSAIPVFVLQGTVTLLARFLSSVLTPAALSNLAYVGNILVFCVGWNLINGKKRIRVVNLLPALLIAVIWAFAVGS